MTWFRPRGTLAGADGPVSLDPSAAGWEHCGLQVVELAPGAPVTLDLGTVEALVVPMTGSCSVEVEGGSRYSLAGRTSVLTAVPDVLYLPARTRFQLSTVTGGEVAVATADDGAGGDPLYRPADAVAVEVRGSGPATRQVNQLLPPEVAGPGRLIVVEVLTPAGNWSSYPPHKHDQATDVESPLEEIYYFRLDGRDGFGLHRTYTIDGSVDDTVVVHDHDVYLVPRGYHGPCVAAPGYDLYYLNVMAGPERRWSITYDPAHEWVLGTWDGQGADPRLPMTGPAIPPTTGPAPTPTDDR